MPMQKSQRVATVSEVVSLINKQLEVLSPLCVQGEISEFKIYTSGHWYFTIKDRDSQLHCAMWKSIAVRQKVPHVGSLVKLYGSLSVYGRNGSLSFIATKIEDAGEGALYEEFLRLKNKLEAQGLFAQSIKKSIVRIPRRVGIVTSPQAAALYDVLNRLRERSPYVHVDVYPALVQGEGAAQSLIDAIKRANDYLRVDVILLVRGGGSIQDLWSFNDENLVHAIRESSIPIIAGVGHETDITLADLAADLRAPTPTAAAEVAAEKKDVLLSELESHWRPIALSIASKMNLAEQDVVHFSGFYESSKRFLEPLRRHMQLAWPYKSFPMEKFERNFSSSLDVIRTLLHDKIKTREDEVGKGADWLIKRSHSNYSLLRNQFSKALAGIKHSRPRIEFSKVQNQISMVSKYAVFKMKSESKRLELVNQAMTILDPKKLRAGVAFIFKDGKTVTSIDQLQSHDLVSVMLTDGRFDARVGTISKESIHKDYDNLKSK